MNLKLEVYEEQIGTCAYDIPKSILCHAN